MVYEIYIFVLRLSLKFLKVFLKRIFFEICINFYNEFFFEVWEVNIDVQFIFDGYVCVVYIVLYIFKLQRGMLNLMYEVCEEVRYGNMFL